jgi:hypothetical protein
MFTLKRSQFAALAVAFVVLFSSVGGVAAQSNNPEWGQELYEQVEGMQDQYNANADQVDLGPVNLAGTMNVYVNDGDEQATYSFTMNEDNEITSMQQGLDPTAPRKITTTRATLERIANSDNPAAAFRSAVLSGEIDITGEDGELIETIKWEVAKFLLDYI